MLHIVQVVLSGSAEPPKVFVDKALAESAFVDCAKTYWAQSYAAYCERNGVDSGCFASAQAFVAAFDLADRSRIHYWSMMPEDAGAADINRLLPGAAALMEGREHVLRLVHEVEQASVAVREGLAGLLETIAGLTGDGAGAVSGQNAPGRLAATEPPSSPPPREAPKPSAYDAGKWKGYAESIKGMCGGNRSEFNLFNRYDWRQAVYSNETSFEYWEWVAAQIYAHIEKAHGAGYTVVDDPDYRGAYRFKTPDGVIDDISCGTEGEAWCRAGLHSEGR